MLRFENQTITLMRDVLKYQIKWFFFVEKMFSCICLDRICIPCLSFISVFKCYVRQLVEPLDRLIGIYFFFCNNKTISSKRVRRRKEVTILHMLENCLERAFELVKHIILDLKKIFQVFIILTRTFLFPLSVFTAAY